MEKDKKEGKEVEKELEFDECPIIDLKLQPIQNEKGEPGTVLLATVQLLEWPGSTIKVLKE